MRADTKYPDDMFTAAPDLQGGAGQSDRAAGVSEAEMRADTPYPDDLFTAAPGLQGGAGQLDCVAAAGVPEAEMRADTLSGGGDKLRSKTIISLHLPHHHVCFCPA